MMTDVLDVAADLRGARSARRVRDLPMIVVPGRAITICLSTVTILVIVLALFSEVCRSYLGIRHGPLNFVPLLDLNDEATLPAYYTSILLFTAAAVLGATAWIKIARREKYGWYWAALAIIFLLLSADETICIHERIAWPIRRILKPQGLWYYGWVIPALAGVIVLGAVYLGFLLHLPRRTRWLFVLAGTMYVSGALGMEMISGSYEQRFGNQTGAYRAMSSTEELLELTGVAVFVYALLDYVRRRWGGFTLLLAGAPNTRASRSA